MSISVCISIKMERWAAYIAERVHLSDNGGCLMWEKATNKHNYGVCKVKLDGDRGAVFTYTHRLAYMTSRNLSREEIANRPVSHLCGNARCVEATHLVLEGQATNNARKVCKSESLVTGNRRCFGHAGHPNCLFQFF